MIVLLVILVMFEVFLPKACVLLVNFLLKPCVLLVIPEIFQDVPSKIMCFTCYSWYLS